MVVAAPAAASPPYSASSRPKNPCATSRQNDLPTNMSRRPLNPSEMDNAASSRRPRAQDITSRYTSSYSCSSSSTSSTSYTSNTTTSSSYSSSSSRRFPSPLSNHRPSTPSKISPALATKRAQSVDRTRPSTPRLDPHNGGRASASEFLDAARTLCTTTRSLSVSFQGQSFFYQTSKAKTASPVPVRKTTPERRRPATPSRNSNVVPTEQAENSRPVMELHRWPAARTRRSNLLKESVDCSTENQELLSTVRLLRQSMLFDNGTQRASFDGGELSPYSDADTVSSVSNSGTPEFNVPRRAKISSREISIPQRSRQEINSTFRRLPELGTPRSSSGPRGSTTPKLSSIKRSLVDYPFQSPPSSSSRLRGPVRPSSPSKLSGSASPGGVSRTLVISSPAGLPANAPSIISFAAEVRRTKKGENRIEEAHMLRLLHNRHLLWRCVNARANASLMIQRGAAEKILYIAWIAASEMRHSITSKKIKLHFLLHCLKLTTILKDQLLCLEEWSLLDREHWSSLSGSIEALKASTMRLPIVSGCTADLQEVKDAVGSAVHVMQTLGSSTYFLMKVQGASYLVSELAKVAEQEQALLDQSRELLSTLAVLHVKLCSLRAHLLQLKRRFSQR